MSTLEAAPRAAPPELPMYLSVAAAAGMFSTSRSTLYRLMREKKIIGIKRGSSRLLLTASLVEYFQSLPQ